MPRAALRQFEGVMQDTVGTYARHDRFLHDKFALGALKHAPAYRGVLTIGIFAHDAEVDVSGFTAGQRRGHAGHQFDRTQVHILIEFTPEQQQRSPERYMIGDFRGPADGTEIDRVMRSDLSLPIRRHHGPVFLEIIVGREIEFVEDQVDPKVFGRNAQNAQPLRHDLFTYPIARNNSDPVAGFFLFHHVQCFQILARLYPIFATRCLCH